MDWVKQVVNIKRIVALTGLVLLSGLAIGQNTKKGFLSDIGVCTRFSNAGILSDNGYTYVEEGVRIFLIPDKSEEEFNKILAQAKKSPLPIRACNSFLPGSLKSVGAEAAHFKILKFAETAFRRAQIAGVKVIVFGSGSSRNIPDGFSREEARKQFIALCSAMAPIAAKYDVVIVLEPLNSKECNFINTVTEGGEIVNEVNHPNFRLMADIYHMEMEGEGPGSILEYGHLIKHIHIAEKEGRAAPGTHGDDFRPYFEALKKVGYKGRISVECRWNNFNSQVGTAIESLKKQIQLTK